MVGTTLRQRPTQRKPKPSKDRSARKNISYREQTSDCDEFDEPASEDDYESRPLSPRPHKPPPSAQRSKVKVSRKCKSIKPGQRRPFSKKAKISHIFTKAQEHRDTGIQLTGKKMPWQTLPYLIWLSIFDYASRPLVSDTFQPMPSINWLFNVALCCKAFTEPALSTLYYSPPLSPPTRAYRLFEQLATQTDRSTFNYGAKVKYLDVEASGTLLHKYAGQDPIDIGAFFSFTPQLRGVGIHLLSDNPKLRKGVNLSRSTNGRGIYQRSMFSILEEHNVALQDWTWNQLLGRQTLPLPELKEVHNMAPFHTLRKISFVNYEGSINDKAKRREDLFAESLSILLNLESLSFRMCSIISDRLMPLLPDNLQTLEILDCTHLKSPALNTFLAAKGRLLKQLILDHNNSLNLSFLADLAQSCPKLEHLKMDLRYFNSFFAVRDSDPKYEVLFAETERPSWPLSLQSLELYHLRKWSLDVAEIFFSSLTDAARLLPNLRQLRIKASLEASGWRDRVEFRDKFTGRLRHVFLRKSSPPKPHLKSIAAFKAFKKQRSDERRKGRDQKRSIVSSPATQYARKDMASVQLTHVEVPENAAKEEERDSDTPLIKARRNALEESDSNVPLLKVRRSTRVKTQRDDIYTISDSSPSRPKVSRRRKRRKGPDDSSSEDSALEEDVVGLTTRSQSHEEEDGLYVQGLCDVVDVLIDNLRPTEEQLKEADFLDEEASGDEDWNGNDDMIWDDHYAW